MLLHGPVGAGEELDGLPHFHRLLAHDGQATACLYAFDLLWLEAQDLGGLELIGRRRMLQKAIEAPKAQLAAVVGRPPPPTPIRRPFAIT